jgi:hypothetical protein
MTIETSLEFFRHGRTLGREPLVLLTLDTLQGRYVFSDAPVKDEVAGLMGPPQADGQRPADGGTKAGEGSYQVLAVAPLVERFGSIRESLQPAGGDLLAGLQQDEAGSLSLRLLNQGEAVADLEALGGLLSATGQILIGYAGLRACEYMPRFQGLVQSYQMDRGKLVLKLRAV